jgi:hypothetical protein
MEGNQTSLYTIGLGEEGNAQYPIPIDALRLLPEATPCLPAGLPNSQCPMPNAQCPIPNSQFSIKLFFIYSGCCITRPWIIDTRNLQLR